MQLLHKNANAIKRLDVAAVSNKMPMNDLLILHLLKITNVQFISGNLYAISSDLYRYI